MPDDYRRASQPGSALDNSVHHVLGGEGGNTNVAAATHGPEVRNGLLFRYCNYIGFAETWDSVVPQDCRACVRMCPKPSSDDHEVERPVVSFGGGSGNARGQQSGRGRGREGVWDRGIGG